MLYLLTYADMRAVGPGVLTRLAGADPPRALRAHAEAAHGARRAAAARANRTQIAERLHAAVEDEIERRR